LDRDAETVTDPWAGVCRIALSTRLSIIRRRSAGVGLDFRLRPGVDVEPDLAFPGRRPPSLHRLLREFAQVQRLTRGNELAGVRSGQKEQLVGQACQLPRFLQQDPIAGFVLGGRPPPAQGHLQLGAYQRERGAQLVRRRRR
jgi:hypothetical protein